MEYLKITTARQLSHLYIAQKLDFLANILADTRTSFVELGQQCIHRPIRETVLTLAAINQQCLSELASMIRSLGAEKTFDNQADLQTPLTGVNEPAGHEDTVLRACSDNENRIIKAYRQILAEDMYPDIKDLLNYQVKGFVNTFLQIRQLFSCRQG